MQDSAVCVLEQVGTERTAKLNPNKLSIAFLFGWTLILTWNGCRDGISDFLSVGNSNKQRKTLAILNVDLANQRRLMNALSTM